MDSYNNAANLKYLEDLYARYLDDPSSLPDAWHRYFAEIEGDGASARGTVGRAARGTNMQPPGVMATTVLDRLGRMIETFREKGHRAARVDPLDLRPRRERELDPEYHGFSSADEESLFPCDGLQFSQPASLREIIARLRSTYCGSVGAEFAHLRDESLKQWLQERMEAAENRPTFGKAQQQRIFSRLTDAAAFEEFIRRKFLGSKSFSIEGAESLIPMMDTIIERAAAQGVDEIVVAMAHRGRLNVLAHMIGKKPREIFREFADAPGSSWEGSGDVKYHLGHSHDYQTSSGRKVHLSLCFNPSHLEFVNPVALGRTRAKQDRAGDRRRRRGMALLIHGDAGIAGEGIIQETLNLSRLDGYQVGGSLHVIVNNQIGFTTTPEEGRSSPYATDVARMLDIPVFHVNGDDPEAVAWVAQLAMDFRQTFGRDAMIDMYCYRRWGHNEGDEPSFTQPMLYQAIKKQKTVREGYLQRLLERGNLTKEEAEQAAAEVRSMLDQELAAAREESGGGDGTIPFRGVWDRYRGGLEQRADDPPTALKPERAAALLEAQNRLPGDFHPHPKIQRAMTARGKMARGERPLDWSAAEALAFASLATEGVRVRLSGQDSARGTFSQRHATLFDYQNGRPYMPLQRLAPDQAAVEIINSPLSEAGVLGFEYGYSLDCPDALVLWEAQFGDFGNAAQVIIDQFITTAEEKWRRLSGLVLLLPHGFEGMGPEHSSARLERFLQLGAKDNIQVVYPTSPAQYFHCLRRQALRRWRKPLIVLTPKSLLRHPDVVSPLQDFSVGRFEPIIPDRHAQANRVKRIVLCSGKLFYELDRRRKESKREDVAIIRIEQLYPLPEEALRRALEVYSHPVAVCWAQEEPENMGAWPYLQWRFQGELFGRTRLSAVCRPAAASPATGWHHVHKKQQDNLLASAIGEETEKPGMPARQANRHEEQAESS